MDLAKRFFGIIRTQPFPRPRSEFADFDDLLEKDEQSTPGFEIFAAINTFEIKRRERKGGDDYWETSWRYDIVGDRRQSLLLGVKEIQPFNCFAAYSVVVSAFTDLYSDPVFVCYINNQEGNQCCKITTANSKMIMGRISVSQHGKILLENEMEGIQFKVTSNVEEPSRAPSRASAVYDVWDDSKFVGSVTMEKGHFMIFTVESLSPASKVLFFGLSFYLSA